MKFKTMTILATLVLLSMPALTSEEYSDDYKLGFWDGYAIIGPIIAERDEIFNDYIHILAIDEMNKELNKSEIYPYEGFLVWQYVVAQALNDLEDRRVAFNRNVSKPDDRIIERFGEDYAQNLSLILLIPPFAPEEESSIPPTTNEPIESTSGSRENPVPMREYSVTLSDGWKITVLDVIPDATQLVFSENKFNEPPKSGYQFFLAKIRACYTGSGSDKFEAPFIGGLGTSYRLCAVGDSNVVYDNDNRCGVIPEPLPDSEVYSGGCIEGYIGWEIRTSDAYSLVMFDNPQSFGSTTGERVYLSLIE